MGVWKLCLVLLLPLAVCFDNDVNLVKRIGKHPDVTPLCTNETQNIITQIVCRISTERNREACLLGYQYEHGFEHGCDFKFKLVTENQTVFLHLNSLAPVDSGNATCECSYTGGTNIARLHFTVEEDELTISSTGLIIVGSSTGATIVIIITGVILGCIHWRKSHGSENITQTGFTSNVCSRSEASELSVHDSPTWSDYDDTDDLYASLQQPAEDEYETIASVNQQLQPGNI